VVILVDHLVILRETDVLDPVCHPETSAAKHPSGQEAVTWAFLPAIYHGKVPSVQEEAILVDCPEIPGERGRLD